VPIVAFDRFPSSTGLSNDLRRSTPPCAQRCPDRACSDRGERELLRGRPSGYARL